MRYRVDPEGFSDWAGLLDLLKESFAYMEGRIDPPSSLGELDAEGLRQKALEEVLLLVQDRVKPVACAFLKPEPDKVYIGKVAVSPDVQGRGLGRNIVSMAIDFTRAQQKPVLELETRIELVENHRIFAALGFEKIAETAHSGFNRPTSITMQRKV